MTESPEFPNTEMPPTRIRGGRILLSERAVYRFAKYVPEPEVIWGIGAVLIWAVLWFTAVGAGQKHPSASLQGICGRSTAGQCTAECGDGYFGLLVASALSVALVGVLFQVLAILRRWGRMKVANIALLFLTWSIVFVILYVGIASFWEIDSGTWSRCLSPFLSNIAAGSLLIVGFALPLVLVLLGASTITYRIWRAESTEVAQNLTQPPMLRRIRFIGMLLFIHGLLGMISAVALVVTVQVNPEMYFNWVAPVGYLSAGVSLLSMVAALRMLHHKRNGLIMGGIAVATELALMVLFVVFTHASLELFSLVIPLILVYCLYRFFTHEPERSLFA